MRELFIILGFIIGGIVFMAASLLLCLSIFAFYYRIRRKGYSPIQTYGIFLLAWGVQALLESPLLIWTIMIGDRGSIAIYFILAAIAFGAFILFMLLWMYCLRFLPNRRNKSYAVSGILIRKKERSTLFSSYIGIALSYYLMRIGMIALCLYIATAALLFRRDEITAEDGKNTALIFYPLAILLFILLLFRITKRLAEERRQSLFNPKEDPFVLYIRSFSVEIDIFSRLKIPGARSFLAMKTFDQFFSKAVSDSIGPLVSLGSPIDHWVDRALWRNAWSSRTYYPGDELWKVDYSNKLAVCKAVFLHSGTTENIAFELRQILSGGFTPKLFIMTKPARGTKLTRVMVSYLNWLRGTPTIKWPSFAALLRECGYEVQDKEPPAGSVLAFDHIKVVTLQSGLTRPQEYICCVTDRLQAVVNGQ